MITDAQVNEFLSGNRPTIIAAEMRRVLVEATGGEILLCWPVIAKLCTDAAVTMAVIDPTIKSQVLTQLDGMKALVEAAGDPETKAMTAQ